MAAATVARSDAGNSMADGSAMQLSLVSFPITLVWKTLQLRPATVPL
jgi:hypothetical protein